MQDLINLLIEKRLQQKEKDLFEELLNIEKITSEFVIIANPTAKPLIAEMIAKGFEIYCVFSSVVEENKVYLVTDKTLKDMIKGDLI